MIRAVVGRSLGNSSETVPLPKVCVSGIEVKFHQAGMDW